MHPAGAPHDYQVPPHHPLIRSFPHPSRFSAQPMHTNTAGGACACAYVAPLQRASIQ
ncbi:hypothetical protein PYCCODRAFT_1435453 [Trametes coccinea BRFM310]|uniref:Uncharacterized protein n=1 Tax=Trametes coccinea (strain BRFM310) TaxID=1353009 RepID=A0A1Y2IMY2_TRAC3|nr:hypothetical protein PYCCODRAFT_1435453 [Trametes coccinea BRFM310]